MNIDSLVWIEHIFVLFLGGLILHHRKHLKLLTQWLKNPVLETIPDGMGAWGNLYSALYRLVRQQSKDKKKLSNALERFIGAGEAMPDGVLVLDASDRIEWMNPMAMIHFGLEGHRDFGQQLTYLVRQPHLLEYLTTQNFKEPLFMRTGVKNEILLSVQLVPFETTHKLLLSRDITQLERVQEIHRDFVANVSHELRTPLTVVGGFLETLSDLPSDTDPALYRKYLPVMQEQAKRMQNLVEDLLTLSRLENGQSPEGQEEINMPQLMQMLLTEAHGLSQGRHLIQLEIKEKHWLYGNAHELHSALGNLVSNAIRYTPEKGTITLKWYTVGDEPVFSVEDTGIGIDAHHLPRLTERFYRVDRGRSRGTGGTGLGLAIVKHALMRHQARLDIISTPGKGSQFSVIFQANRLRQGTA